MSTSLIFPRSSVEFHTFLWLCVVSCLRSMLIKYAVFSFRKISANMTLLNAGFTDINGCDANPWLLFDDKKTIQRLSTSSPSMNFMESFMSVLSKHKLYFKPYLGLEPGNERLILKYRKHSAFRSGCQRFIEYQRCTSQLIFWPIFSGPQTVAPTVICLATHFLTLWAVPEPGSPVAQSL